MPDGGLSIDPVITGIFTLCASVGAFITAFIAAQESGKTAKEVARQNGEISQNIANLNATLNRALKEHEFELAYQKELALKRLMVYDEFSEKVSIFIVVQQDGRQYTPENRFYSPRDSPSGMAEYGLSLEGLATKMGWLEPETREMYFKYIKKVRQVTISYKASSMNSKEFSEAGGFTELKSNCHELLGQLTKDCKILFKSSKSMAAHLDGL